MDQVFFLKNQPSNWANPLDYLMSLLIFIYFPLYMEIFLYSIQINSHSLLNHVIWDVQKMLSLLLIEPRTVWEMRFEPMTYKTFRRRILTTAFLAIFYRSGPCQFVWANAWPKSAESCLWQKSYWRCCNADVWLVDDVDDVKNDIATRGLSRPPSGLVRN